MIKKIAILGSTGSIGKTLINVIKKDKKFLKLSYFLLIQIKELLKQLNILKLKI